MANGFIGLKIPEAEKALLQADAEAQGVSLSELCKQRLAPNSITDTTPPRTIVRHHRDSADRWEALVDELRRLEAKREELIELIQEREGFFTSAPASLKLALRAADSRIKSSCEELRKLLPAEEEKSWLDF